jgi:hypothetical protein
MGNFITDVKVTLDQERRRDKPFYFKILSDGTDEDMIEIIGRGLQQKLKEGEITEEDVRRTKSIKIDADDKKGYFASIIGDVGKFFKQF